MAKRRKKDLVTVDLGSAIYKWDVPPDVKWCPFGGRPVPRVLAYTLERELRGIDTPASRQVAAHVRDIHKMISAIWTHPGKVEASYTVCIASASNLTGLVKSSVECRRTGL